MDRIEIFDEPLIAAEESRDGVQQRARETVVIEEKSNEALKYSILITAVIVLIFLMVVAFCVFRCVASKREDVHAAIKAHKLQQSEQDDSVSA